MKKIPTVRYFKSPSAHLSTSFSPLSINPTDAPPQSSILIMKPTTTNHRNFRHLYSQPNIQFISYQDLHLQTHHQNQMMARTSSMPPSRNDGKKNKDMLCIGSQANYPIYWATKNFLLYLKRLVKNRQEGMDGWIDVNINENNNNNKKLIAPPEKCRKRTGKGDCWG